MGDELPSVSFELCVGKARQVLEFAESETDLLKMERYEKLADSWIALAHIVDRARDLSSWA